jgi:bacillopeptidase F
MKSKALILLLLFLLFRLSLPSQIWISPGVSALMQSSWRSGQHARFFVAAKAPFNADSLRNSFQQRNIPMAKRAKTVYHLSQKHHHHTTRLLRNWLENNSTAGVILQSYFLVNSFELSIQISEVNALVTCGLFSEIYLSSELVSNQSDPVEMRPDFGARAPGAAEIGLYAINAHKMWARGFSGRGRVAYIVDTGVWPSHPALDRGWKGRYLPLFASWYGFDNILPTDKGNSHGTHVTGTILGLDRVAADTIGAAFNAYYMVADPVVGNAADIKPLGQIMHAFEWALNPDGDTSTWTDVPDVVNNSWGHKFDSAEAVCRSPFARAVEALQLAGAAVVWSAGNEGPGAKTVGSPATISLHPHLVFSVGAINASNAALPLASFSSNGPSWCADTGQLAIKPEVVAPGVNVRSATGTGSYAYYSGTSMASPHVSGAVLLLKEAFPFLSGEQILEALFLTAYDLGNPGEDNLYGNGMIDVEAAFLWLSNTHMPQLPTHQFQLAVFPVEVDTSPIFCSDHYRFAYDVVNKGSAALSGIRGKIFVGGEWLKNIAISTTLAPGASLRIRDTIPSYKASVAIMYGQIDITVRITHDSTHLEGDTIDNGCNFMPNFRHLSPSASAGFLTFSKPLRDWYIDNPDRDFTWQRKVVEGDTLIFLEIFRNNLRGRFDALISPLLNGNNAMGEDTIAIELAYRNKFASAFRDSLIISSSKDCGASWKTVFIEELNHLRANPIDTPAYFLPSTDDWYWVRFPARLKNVLLKIAVKSDFGNNVFLRSIMVLPSVVGLGEPLISNLSVFPNPASEEVKIQVSGNSSPSMYTIAGVPVSVPVKESSGRQYIFDVRHLPAGFYIIRHEAASAKFVISR